MRSRNRARRAFASMAILVAARSLRRRPRGAGAGAARDSAECKALRCSPSRASRWPRTMCEDPPCRGDIPHTFRSPSTHLEARGAGRPLTFEFRADKVGTFTFYCDLRLRTAADMRGYAGGHRLAALTPPAAGAAPVRRLSSLSQASRTRCARQSTGACERTAWSTARVTLRRGSCSEAAHGAHKGPGSSVRPRAARSASAHAERDTAFWSGRASQATAVIAGRRPPATAGSEQSLESRGPGGARSAKSAARKAARLARRRPPAPPDVVVHVVGHLVGQHRLDFSGL